MNWNLPTLTSLYTDVIDLIKERTEDVATMFRSSSSTNIPTGSIRWSDTNSRFESWNGSAWVELDSLYEIKVRDSDKLQGATPSDSAGNSTIVKRSSSGYIRANYFNTSSNTTTSGASNYFIETSNDGYIRKKTVANVRAEIVTASDVLTKIKTVDSNTSGLNAQYLQGSTPSDASTANTIVKRNSSGDINARLFRSEYDSTNGSIGYIMTQVDTASNNYIRPSTPTQVLSALGLTSVNKVIGTDSDINTSGATIIDNIYVTDGVITSMGTRTLTASDIGVVDYDSAHSFTTNGYQKLSNGLILQWGKRNTISTDETIPFNITFPTSCSNIHLSYYGSLQASSVSVSSNTNSSFTVDTSSTTQDYYWFAIGY